MLVLSVTVPRPVDGAAMGLSVQTLDTFGFWSPKWVRPGVMVVTTRSKGNVEDSAFGQGNKRVSPPP